jgi:hypothetical protein
MRAFLKRNEGEIYFTATALAVAFALILLDSINIIRID